MNIYFELNKVIEYIENHLEDKIEYKKLSQMIGVNEYTFLRIFNLISNISLSEYIRNRRLSNAGQELYLNNDKIIDIAIKYQYNNPTAFSRAFEKFHGIKPSEIRKNPKKLKMYPMLHFNEIEENNKNIEYKIIEKDEMILYGKYIITDNDCIGKDAPIFYQRMNKLYGEPNYGLVEYKEKERSNVKAYWILYDSQKVDFEKVIIPKSKWILFRINSQDPKDIQEASKTFYFKFLPGSKYNLKDLPEIEHYHNDITDFLVPIED